MKKTAVSLREVPDAAPAGARGPVVLAGHERVVDRLVELAATIDAAKAEQEEQRVELDGAADALRVKTEVATGHACKSMQALGSTFNGKYTFADRYSPIDPDSVPELQAAIGKKHFGKLFVPSRTIKVKKGAEERLLAVLLEKGIDTDEFLSVDPTVVAVDDFREERARLRAALSAEQNRQLDQVVAQIAEKPRLALK